MITKHGDLDLDASPNWQPVETAFEAVCHGWPSACKKQCRKRCSELSGDCQADGQEDLLTVTLVKPRQDKRRYKLLGAGNRKEMSDLADFEHFEKRFEN